MDLHAVVICYDVSNKDSFGNVEMWYKEIKDNGYDELEVFLVGLKTDKGSAKRMVKERDAAGFARNRKIGFMEVSAKSGDKVKDLFVAISKRVLYFVGCLVFGFLLGEVSMGFGNCYII